MTRVLSFSGSQGLLITQQDSSSPMHSHVEDSDLEHLLSFIHSVNVYSSPIMCQARGRNWRCDMVFVLKEL